MGELNLDHEVAKISRGSVILVHGIRTHADWFQQIRKLLIEEGYKVYLTNYGRFDLVSFLLPINYSRNKVKEKIYRQIRAAIKKDGGEKYSIIAHSFGTYIVSNILRDEFDLKIDRVIFAGSVVRYDFPFEQFSERFTGDILNEVATQDPWPVVAESLTTGYGSAGTYGFKRPSIFDRWNVGGHSHVLTASHCKEFWLPFLRDGEVKEVDVPTKVGFFINLIHVVKLKFVICISLICLITLWLLCWAYAAQPATIKQYPGKSGWLLSDGDVAKTINAEMDEECPFRWLPGSGCDFWLAKFITKRSWRGVEYYDHSLNEIIFPNEFVFTYTDPEKFWYQLREEYSNCIVITEFEGRLKLTRDQRCNLPLSTE